MLLEKQNLFFFKKNSHLPFYRPNSLITHIDIDSFDYVNKKQYNNKLNRNPNGTRNK